MVVKWLRYCRYDIKDQLINQHLFQVSLSVLQKTYKVMYSSVVLFGVILEDRMFDLFSCLFFLCVFLVFCFLLLFFLVFFWVCLLFYLFVLFLYFRRFFAPSTVTLFHSILRVFVKFADFRLTFSKIFYEVFLVEKTIQFFNQRFQNIFEYYLLMLIEQKIDIRISVFSTKYTSFCCFIRFLIVFCKFI